MRELKAPGRGWIAIALALVATRVVAQDAPPAAETAAEGQGHIQASAPSDPDDWAIERFDFRFAFFYQDGPGWQSQASTQRHAQGSQQALIFQPILATRVRSGEHVWHDVSLPIDVVSSASADALDAVSSASRDNESFILDIYSHVVPDGGTDWTLHYGGHIEEVYRSAWAGFGVAASVADDNALIQFSFDGIYDHLDPIWPNGYDPKAVARWTGTVNMSVSQILSPSTLLQVSYGYTAQLGELATTWNSVPWEGRDRIQERLPSTRSRHAATLTVSQAIPDSRTFGTASYRFYLDDFGILGNTAELQLTQYIVDDVWVRAGYRFHTQTAASFYTELFPSDGGPRDPRTADSDLGRFDAHEASASARWFYDWAGARSALRASWLELSYSHYERTNQLHIDVVALGWGQAL